MLEVPWVGLEGRVPPLLRAVISTPKICSVLFCQ